MPSCNSYTTNPSPPPVDPVDFVAELTAMVTNHWNSPAIIMWDIFNEGQGEAGSANGVNQTNTPYLVSLVKSLDASRLVDQASGWTYFGVGDVMDTHNYPDPLCSTSAVQAVACGEFGGVWQGIQDHTWAPSTSDVAPTQAVASVTSQFQALAGELPGLMQTNGLSAAVYTEISDVEIEEAGLLTFDRIILKPDLVQMHATITSITGQQNIRPTLSAIPNVTITAGQTLVLTNSATDPDVPAQTLTWTLANAPAGASINATNGVLTWRPAIAQSPSTNSFTVVVTDNGAPPLSATQSFNVTVWPPVPPSFSAPTLVSGIFQCNVGGSAGPDYSVYVTTNLASGWQLLLVTNPVAVPFAFIDPTPLNFQQRFYRIVLGP
jgi:hypothetical protein